MYSARGVPGGAWLRHPHEMPRLGLPPRPATEGVGLGSFCNCKLFATRIDSAGETPGMALTSLPEQPSAAISHEKSLAAETGWRRRRTTRSLSEVFGTIATRPQGPLWRKLLAFLGPGYLVAVGYMDPGN